MMVMAYPFAETQVNYDVHLKYARHIARLSKRLSAQTSLRPVISGKDLRDLDAKLRLVERTRDSLAEEIRCINTDAEYAHACVAWLPAKVYYNLYHLLSIIQFMVTGERSVLRISHTCCLGDLANHIRHGRILFTCALFNQVCNKAILGFRSQSGEVLSGTISDDRLFSLIMKKIATDKLEDLKIRKSINRRTKEGKKLYAREENKLNISVLDFFYSMRIRTNYKDMSFVDDVDAESARKYFVEYFEAADNFHACFNGLKNELIGMM